MSTLTPQDIRDELSRKGDLSWLYYPEQEQMLESWEKVCSQRTGNKLWVGLVARQTGKTYFAVCEAIGWAIRNPNSTIFYGSGVYEDLKKFIHPRFDEILAHLPPDIRPRRSGPDYHFSNGSTIFVVGLDKNREAGRGNTIDLYVFEEAGFIQYLEHVYQKVVLKAMRKRPNGRVMMISTPPSSPDHPFREYYQLAQARDNAFFMDVTMTSATPKEIESYKRECKTESEWESEYMCLFVTDDQLAVLPNFGKVRSSILIKDYPRPQFFNIHTTGDHGHKDHTGLVFGYFDYYNNKIVVEDSVALERPLTSDIAREIHDREDSLFGVRAGYRPIDASPQVIADLNGIYNCISNKVSLKTKMRDRTLRLLEIIKEGMLVIKDTPNNRLLANEMEYALWTNWKKTDFERSRIYGHYDRLAALAYYCDTIDVLTNPTPDNFGISESTHLIISPQEYNKDRDMDDIAMGFTKQTDMTDFDDMDDEDAWSI